LRVEYLTLNPVALRRQIEAAQVGLWRLAGVRNTREATRPRVPFLFNPLSLPYSDTF
jgi:hypothetical protein